MRNDVWVDQTHFLEKKNRLFSQQGALTIAVNWGTGLFTVGLFAVCLLAVGGKTHKTKLPRLIGIVALASIVLVGFVYLSLPKTEVRFVHPWDKEISDSVTPVTSPVPASVGSPTKQSSF